MKHASYKNSLSSCKKNKFRAIIFIHFLAISYGIIGFILKKLPIAQKQFLINFFWLVEAIIVKILSYIFSLINKSLIWLDSFAKLPENNAAWDLISSILESNILYNFFMACFNIIYFTSLFIFVIKYVKHSKDSNWNSGFEFNSNKIINSCVIPSLSNSCTGDSGKRINFFIPINPKNFFWMSLLDLNADKILEKLDISKMLFSHFSYHSCGIDIFSFSEYIVSMLGKFCFNRRCLNIKFIEFSPKDNSFDIEFSFIVEKSSVLFMKSCWRFWSRNSMVSSWEDMAELYWENNGRDSVVIIWMINYIYFV